MLEKTVKWSTFCVRFIRALTILGWLKCLILKIDYLVTSNVQFEMVSQNQVTYVTQSWETEPNHTSGKIKLIPPARLHTTVLLVSS